MAVYTSVTDDEAREFLARFPIGEYKACKGIEQGIENSNFWITTTHDATEAAYILTLFEKRVNPAHLPYFIGLMTHLSTHVEVGGPAVPTPVADRENHTLFSLKGKKACLATVVPGMPRTDITPQACRHTGRAMALLHRAGQGFQPTRPNDLSLAAWRPLSTALSRTECAAVSDTLYDDIRRTLAFLEAHWPEENALPRGHIHADLFPDNVFFSGEAISGFIDFYFACHDLLAWDIAVAIISWCFDASGKVFFPAHQEALLQGYEEIRRLHRAEHTALPILCQGAALRFLLTRLYDWTRTSKDALVQAKLPLECKNWLDYYAR